METDYRSLCRDFDMELFIKDVFNDDYALVIGNEVVLDTRVEPTGDVSQYLLRRVNEHFGTNYQRYNDIALMKDERKNPVRELVQKGIIRFEEEAVSPELKALLETKVFRTILTTTTDGFLETVLRRIFPDLQVVNIYDDDSMNRFRDEMRECRGEQEYKAPTLVYVFGKMEKNWQKSYLRTDDDAIHIIEKWMRMDVEGNNELLDFIREKRLLALGCKYDVWYFRFFWYILNGDKRIIPLAINGYDPKADYHQTFVKVVGQDPTVENLMEPDGFFRLTEAIKKTIKGN